jgi:hypothetical protein
MERIKKSSVRGWEEKDVTIAERTGWELCVKASRGGGGGRATEEEDGGNA